MKVNCSEVKTQMMKKNLDRIYSKNLERISGKYKKENTNDGNLIIRR